MNHNAGKNLEIREMQTLQDFQQCVELQKEIWGFDDPYDAVPLPLLLVSQRHEGVVLGAYDGDRMIGFVYSLPGFHHGHKLQWSHMLAVQEDYRNTNIGYRLKIEQYKMSEKNGYEYIEWTYDPLESKNAYFNLNKLGCIAREYEVNIYGETSSPLHQGTPTDRLIAHWPIPPIQKQPYNNVTLPEPSKLVTKTRVVNELLYIEAVDLHVEEEPLFVEIPPEIQRLKAKSADAALQWRLQTRQVFLHYFEKGYVASSFIHRSKDAKSSVERSFYVLKRIV